jgi:NAD+ diphosphatase
MKTKPLDVFKFCPKCGSAQFPHDGPRHFNCQKCGFDFYINSSAAVAAIIENQQGEILLTIRANEPQKGYLDLPGGFVDPMESAEEALIREIKEELNLDIVDMHYIGSFPNEYIFSGLSVFTTDLGFAVKVDSLRNIQSNDDITGYVFKNIQDIDFSRISSASIANLIRRYEACKK